MDFAEIIDLSGNQAVRLPPEFRFDSDKVAIHRKGDSVILSPLPVSEWPTDFFSRIKIVDPAFVRPAQGDMPPSPSI